LSSQVAWRFGDPWNHFARAPREITISSTILRVLANQWLSCSIGRAIGLTIPEPAIGYVSAKLVESSPSLAIQLFNSPLKCSHRVAFGSHCISEGEVFHYLPRGGSSTN